ncbi:hypothetical protein BDD12DRAFT_900732 [Trichophaea hybrida]|nr:hypothetical protein BDD12DRAFT_900732 [Trichophaea hybrida]
MPKKNCSKKSKGTQVSSSSSFSPPREADSSSVASILKPATGQQRLPFGERKYHSDCGSDSVPEWQSEDEDDDHSDEVNPVHCLWEEYLCSFDFENKTHVAKVSLHNVIVEANGGMTSNDKAVATLEAKVASLERRTAVQTADATDL